MRVQPGFGETLPALLRRRRGVPERTTLLAAGAFVLLALVAFLLLRDPLEGRTQRVHRSAPVFNTLYLADLVRPVEPRGTEYQRYEARHGAVRLEVTARPLRLPPYRGDVSGVLPVFVEDHKRDLRAGLDGFRLTDEGRARVQGAPGYSVGFTFRDGGRRTEGRDVLVVPDEPGARDGAIITYRETRGRRRPGEAGRARIKAMRSTFRSFKFGADRDD